MKIPCPLCQYEIDTEDRGCVSGCPLGKRCSLVCCPRCRYSFPIPESRLLNWFRSILAKGSRT